PYKSCHAAQSLPRPAAHRQTPSPRESPHPQTRPPSQVDTSSPPAHSSAADTPYSLPTHRPAPSPEQPPPAEPHRPASHSHGQTCSQTASGSCAPSYIHSDSAPSIRCTESSYAAASNRRPHSAPAMPHKT